MTKSGLLAALAAALLISGCATAPQHAQDVAAGRGEGDRLTAGVVQREIREGMSGADVAAALGSPNIVTRDADGRETWVYDRISTEQVFSSSRGGVNALFLAGVNQSAGAASTSQRTLTVVIRFDSAGRVSNFSYRSSSF